MPKLKDIIRSKSELEKLIASANDIKAIIRNTTIPGAALKAKNEAHIQALRTKEVTKNSYQSVVSLPPPPPLIEIPDIGGQSRIHPDNTLKFIFELLKYIPTKKGAKEVSFIPGSDINDNQADYRLNYHRKKFQFIPRNSVMFWATLSSISEGNSPDWTPTEYFGRTEKMYKMSTTDRTLSLSFTLASFTEEEVDINIKKLNFLTQCVYPGPIESTVFGRQPPFIRLTLGNLYKQHLAIITTLDVDLFQDNIPWDTEKEVPLVIGVTTSITLLFQDKEQPTFNSTFFNSVK